MRSAVRRSCQTMAGASGSPDAASHATAVSRWFVIPSATGSSLNPDRRRAMT